MGEDTRFQHYSVFVSAVEESPGRVGAVLIRPARVGDLAEVAAIFAHYVTGTVSTFEEVPPTVEWWGQRLADVTGRGLPFLVAEVEGGVAGYAYAGSWRDKPAYRHTVEDSIYVRPDRTGLGIGGALLSRLLGECARAGARRMIAVIADSGDASSTELHRRHGFTEVGRLVGVGFKHGRWWDTALWQRPLGVAGWGAGPGVGEVSRPGG